MDDVRANNTEMENGDFLTISKIVEQKQIFEKRLKYRQVKIKIQNLTNIIVLSSGSAGIQLWGVNIQVGGGETGRQLQPRRSTRGPQGDCGEDGNEPGG